MVNKSVVLMVDQVRSHDAVSDHVMSCDLVDVWTLSFSPDGKTIATGSHNGHINLFNVDTGEKQSSLDTRGKFTMSIAHVSCNYGNIIMYCTMSTESRWQVNSLRCY